MVRGTLEPICCPPSETSPELWPHQGSYGPMVHLGGDNSHKCFTHHHNLDHLHITLTFDVKDLKMGHISTIFFCKVLFCPQNSNIGRYV